MMLEEPNCTTEKRLVVLLLYCFVIVASNGSHRENENCRTEIATVFVLEETPNGVCISLTSDITVSPVAEIPDVILPQPECGLDLRRCPLECRKYTDGLLCHFPVRNDTGNYLALVYLEHSPSDPTKFQQKATALVSPESDCVPLRVYDRGLVSEDDSVQFFVPCLDLTSNETFLYFERLVLADDLAHSCLDGRTWISKEYIKIEDNDVSTLVYIDGTIDSNCSPPRNVFVKVGHKVIVFSIHDDYAEFVIPENEIKHCPVTESFLYFEPDYVRVQCSPDDVVIYDVCNTEEVVERYNTSINATVYQCQDADLNIYLFKENITYSRAREDYVITLPFNDTVTAQCVGSDSPVLFIARSTGETYFLHLYTENLYYIAVNTCTSSSSCLKLDILEAENSLTVGVLDYSNNTYIMLDLTCPSIPMVSRKHYPNPPLSFTLVASGIYRPCPPCKVIPPNTDAPSSDNNTISVDPSFETQGTNGNSLNSGAVIGVTGGGALVLIIGIIAVSLAVLFAVLQCRKKQSSQPNSTSTSSISNESSSEGSPAPDQSTTEQSLSESDVTPVPPPAAATPNQLAIPIDNDDVTCVPSQADDQGHLRTIVQPSPTSDYVRYTSDEVVEVHQARVRDQDHRNNRDEKVMAVQRSGV